MSEARHSPRRGERGERLVYDMKKEYKKPEMKVVELLANTAILAGSTVGANDILDTSGGNITFDADNSFDETIELDN